MPTLPQDAALIQALTRLATIAHEPREEDMDPADCFGYDTEEENRAAVVRVRTLAARTPWGWCCVETTATYAGHTAVVYLGACSYKSEQDFRDCDEGTQAYEACAALLGVLRDTEAAGKRAAEALVQLRQQLALMADF